MFDPASRDRKGHLLEAVLLSLAFALAYTQSPLFFSNQNQYLLHGLAKGGYGNLTNDWLARTKDPTPVFSAIVAGLSHYLGLESLQVVYFLMLALYFLSVRWLVGALPFVPATRSFRLAFAAVFTATHAAILRVASVELTGVDDPWYLQAGVAGQYMLGPGLQPSAFGILLMTSLAAFANGRPTLAAALAAVPCVFHSTYLLPASLLLFGYMAEVFRSRPQPGPLASRMLLAAIVFMTPVAADVIFTFGPSKPDLFQESQRILAEVRIPHHCLIDRWFDWVAGLQLAWVVLGIALLRRSPLSTVLSVVLGVAVVLSLLQYVTENPSLALMFPWRISVLLVPAATAVIVTKALSYLPPARWVDSVAGALCLVLAGAGVWVMAAHLGYHAGEDEQPLYDFVRSTAEPNDVYLLPVRIPPVGKGRGSISTSFTPPPRPAPGSNLIPVDLQRFRLMTGTPIYVDFKAVPYGQDEVLDWISRMRRCEEWYRGTWSRVAIEETKHNHITHVVTPADRPIHSSDLEEVHADPAYIVYKVK